MRLVATAFEFKVEQIEGVCVLLRVPRDTLVEDYPFERAAPDDMSVASWLAVRVRPWIGHHDVAVIDPRYMRDGVGRGLTMKILRDATAIAVNGVRL